MCLRASDPAGHHGLDIMDGVDCGTRQGDPVIARSAG